MLFKASCRVEPLGTEKEAFYSESTKDLSLRGVYVKTQERLEVGTPCRLEIELTGSTSRLILAIKARVVRVDQEGMAFLFDEIDLDSFFHLKNILYYNSGDPDRIDREIISIKG